MIAISQLVYIYSRWPMIFGNPAENNLQHHSISSTTSPPHHNKHRSKSDPISREVSSAFNSVAHHRTTSPPPSTSLPLRTRPSHPSDGTSHRTVPSMNAVALPPSLPPVLSGLYGLGGPFMTPGSAGTTTAEERAHTALLGLMENTPCPPPPHHPVFPMAMNLWGIQPSHPYSLPPLHPMFGGEKSFLNSTIPYHNDPLAMAASAAKSQFFDLARLQGQYPMGKKLFGCPQCRYITDRKNNLKRHVSTMHQECEKVLECCGVVFKNKASLRDHVLIFHSNGYMCRFCGRNFCRKALLKRHLTVHSGQKDYLCTLCDYATSHKSNLERHKKVHERQGTDDEREDDDDEMIPETPPISPTRSSGLFLHGTIPTTSVLPDHHAIQQRMMAMSEHMPGLTSPKGLVRKQKLTSHSIADIYKENLHKHSTTETSSEDEDQNDEIDVVDIYSWTLSTSV